MEKNQLVLLIIMVTSIWFLNVSGQEQKIVTEAVAITVDLGKTIGRMDPVWAWLGYDEPNYTYMKDGKKLLSEFAEKLCGPTIMAT